jgi:hypothetical protein
MLRAAAAVLTLLIATPALAQAAQPKAPQPLRALSSFASSGWQVVFVGNDERVNHCALERESSGPKPGQPKFMFQIDQKWAILTVRAAEYKFTEKKPLTVTLVGSDGGERQPKAATGGPDRADIAFGNDAAELTSLAGLSHLDVRMDGSTVRLPMDGLSTALPALADCMANIGKPAQGWSSDEVDHLVNAVKNGKATCREDKSGRMICDH